MFQAIIRWLDRRFYPDAQPAWDRVLFRQRMLQELRPDMRILDLGAGRGKSADLDFREHCSVVAGVDVDDAVLSNPHLHEARMIVDGAIPYTAESFDLVFSYDVLEHVAAPEEFFNEVARVLKPGGVFLAKTPNRRHYVAFFARWLPAMVQRWVHRQTGRDLQDTFPTLYRCNTPRALRRLAAECGLSDVTIDCVESRPNYLRITLPTYLLGILYERVVNSMTSLQTFRCILIARMTKHELQENWPQHPLLRGRPHRNRPPRPG